MKKEIVFLSTLFLSACGFDMVETGHVGVKTQFGKIIESGISEGLNFYMPFTGKSINEVDMRMKKASGDESTFTKDNQEVHVSFSINYRFDSKESEFIYRNGNTKYFDIVAPQIVVGVMKEVIGQYDAETIVSKRPKVNSDVQAAIKERLSAKKIYVDNFEVTNFKFDEAYQKAIEDKMIATQRAQEAKNHTVQIEEEKTQAIAKAQGEAEAMRIKSQALAANKNLVEYEAVQKWDGKLPTMMTGNTTPFINLK